MSHVILDHHAEALNRFILSALVMFPVYAVIWAFIPKEIDALVTSYFVKLIKKLSVNLRYSRLREYEADEVINCS